MRRFLVVGCGGSGGNTLAYMMDQLRSDLAKDGVNTLPPGWQFVFVDVPSGIQAGPEGLGNVVQQGGRYIGLAPQGGKYPELDFALTQRLLPNLGLGAFGSWAPRRPDGESTPISVGAGQYRALGRAILLSKVNEVRKQLEIAWQDLSHKDTEAAMEDAAFRTHTQFDANQPAIIIVVSSMAGGAGASMALDVCRLLTTLPNLEPNLMSMFMVTPDVFDSLPETARAGVRANALAMLGEIVASQTGAARRHDVELLGALGRRDGVGAPVPFARVFPVGRFVGVQKARFGDGSPEAVYRGLARGLAGLMMSDTASDQFVNFDLGNNNPDPANPKYLGWGTPPQSLPWGSYGFASLSMGHDRYEEYAAQRIARACVDRLMDGHLQPGSDASPTEQVKSLLDTHWPAACNRIQLPSAVGGSQAAAELMAWFTTVAFPREELTASVNQIVEEFLSFEPPLVGQPVHWLNHVQRAMRDAKPPATQRANELAYRAAVNWQLALLARVEAELGDGVARQGLSYAGAFLERLHALIANFLIPGLDAMGREQAADLAELPVEVVSTLSTQRGVMAGGSEHMRVVLNDARTKLSRQMYAAMARHLGASLKEFVPGAIGPMRAAVADIYQVLRRARESQVTHDGLARLGTDQYAAWPLDSDTARVPDRFGEANNEVMLTPSTAFAGQFRKDLPDSIAPEDRGRDPQAVVSTQVILGLWRTQAGINPPGGLVEGRERWWPRAFSTDPRNGQTERARDAHYDIHARPDELRARAIGYVTRPDESFSKFCLMSLRDYVVASFESDIVRDDRRRDLAGKFRQALAMAVPLISVNAQAVNMLHRRGEGVQYRYKFSAIPLDDLPVSADLEAALRSNRNIDASTHENFAKALTHLGNPRRIDIFGSYPPYSPLVFDSILDPVIQQWDATPPEGRGSFWRLRRARPLDAALPMGDRERQALVAGWYVGQIIGEIRIPKEPYTTPVEIWDPETSSWVGFPYPMLTPPARFQKSYDWLPAVLESILLAMAQVHHEPAMSSLRPYHLLRELYDDRNLDADSAGNAAGMFTIAAQRRFARWLVADSQSGQPSRIDSIAAATNLEERYAAAADFLTGPYGPGRLARDEYLPQGQFGSPGKGEFSVIGNRTKAGDTPIFRDLAADIVAVTAELESLLKRAYENPIIDPAAPDDPDQTKPGPVQGPTF